jgi:hypothetical protein
VIDSTPRFELPDRDNIDFVRQIVLKRLRDDPAWRSFGSQWGNPQGIQYVKFTRDDLRDRFNELSEEVLWQMVSQGIVVPSTNCDSIGNQFRVTDYGLKVIIEGSFIPNDPMAYLNELKRRAPTVMTDTATTYASEALRCHNASCYTAAVLLLGVAAESAFLKLLDSVDSALQDAAERQKLRKCKFVKEKHDWMVTKYQSLDRSVLQQLPQSTGTSLVSLYNFIRNQRNDLGHPQETPPKVERIGAFTFFTLLPVYVGDAQALSDYCTRNQI